jgi:hypothetical protein
MAAQSSTLSSLRRARRVTPVRASCSVAIIVRSSAHNS